VSEQSLQAGYWLVTHKPQLKKALIIFLIVADAALLGYSGWKFTLDLLNGQARTELYAQLAVSGADPALRKRSTAKPLVVTNVQTLAPSDKYDFVATVRNDNADFVARFKYRFASAGFASPVQPGFVFPGQEKFVASLGVASPSRPSNVALEITELVWSRIDRHKIPDWKKFSDNRLNLPFTDLSYNSDIDISTGKTVGKTTFTITNRTGFGYHEVPLLVVMYRGSAIVGVNSTLVENLRPNESRQGEVTWFADFGAVTLIKIERDIDILDDSAYLR
jgi:hypothetical protein